MPESLSSAAPGIAARQKISEPLSQLIREIESRIGDEVEEARVRARRALSEELNQALRQLRQCASTEEVAGWLVDSSAPQYCQRAALFEVSDAELRGVHARGFDAIDIEAFEQFHARLADAPALEQAARERDTVVALSTAGEVSTALLSALGEEAGAKARLVPVVIREKTVAILYAVGEPVDAAALELLAYAAGSAAQTIAQENVTSQKGSPVTRTAPQDLIGIAGVDMQAHLGAQSASESSVLQSNALEREALDARARWFARVEAARLRLFHREALEQGRAQRNIYRALQPQIDAARQAYRKDFLAVSPGIADYLEKELIGLANEDKTLLGPEYPGSLV